MDSEEKWTQAFAQKKNASGYILYREMNFSVLGTMLFVLPLETWYR